MKKVPSFQSILHNRLSRRDFLVGGGMAASALALAGCEKVFRKSSQPNSLTFRELPHNLNQSLAVPIGYKSQVLLRWGDPIFDLRERFDPENQSAQKQSRQFGFNNDFVGFLSFAKENKLSHHGLLVVNHEYTNSKMMFPGSPDFNELTEEQTAIDIMAHGMSVVEIIKKQGDWEIVNNSYYARRITPHTPMQITGPAAGSERLKTAISKDGIHSLGTYGNCAGCVTPWGTVLTGEENIDYMFAGDFDSCDEAENHSRFGMQSQPRKSWAKFHSRWDMNEQPREPLHMGWIVEVDPFDPESVPKKRSALGRFKHEGCNVYINKDQHVVAYCGDDQHFEYLYKFVSKEKYQPQNRQANMRLLDEGTLYCAAFEDDGSLFWLPLVHGHGALTEKNGFNSQADVCIDVRKAADLLGATPLDRPEDVEVNPVTGHVYVILTNNTKRTQDQVDAVNPRAHNKAGQIVELFPPGGDHSAEEFKWGMFLIAGELDDESTNYPPGTSENGWLACPDNCTFDSLGNLWIATDGAEAFGVADGLWGSEVKGANRGLTKRFLRTPIGSELSGPFFTPDDRSLFCSVQHPGEKSSYENPSTRWPDFHEGMPPRPAVVVITKDDQGRVGS